MRFALHAFVKVRSLRAETPRETSMRRLLAFLVVPFLLGAAAADAQSLAEVSRREEARRKQIKKPSPVYTDKDVKPATSAPPPASVGDAATGPTRPNAASDAQPAAREGDEPELTDEEKRAQDEQRWRARITDARAVLERNQVFAEALQSRINSLWADFTARDDPAQRSVIEAERRKAIAQLDRVKSEIVEQTKAIADIEEEARRSGVPPGWLR
jgi:hypothetical protein